MAKRTVVVKRRVVVVKKTAPKEPEKKIRDKPKVPVSSKPVKPREEESESQEAIAAHNSGIGKITFNPAALAPDRDNEKARPIHGKPFVRMLDRRGKKVKCVIAEQVCARLMDGYKFITMEPATPRVMGNPDVPDLKGHPDFKIEARDFGIPSTIEDAEMVWKTAINQDFAIFPDHPHLFRGWTPQAKRTQKL